MKLLLPIALAISGLTSIAMMPAAAASPWSKTPAGIDALLPADQAFQLLSVERSGDLLTVTWAISPGYYLYRKRLGFEAVNPAGAALSPALLPKGQAVADEREGTTEVYRETLKARLHVAAGSPPVQQLRVRYQGCADAGVCYPPVSAVVDVIAAAQ